MAECKHRLKKSGRGFICVKCMKFFKEDITKKDKKEKESAK